MRACFIILGFSGILTCTSDCRDLRLEIERAEQFGRKAASLMSAKEITPFWSEDATRLIYRAETGRGKHQFIEVDLKTGGRSPAFDHVALAGALGEAAAKKPDAGALPLEHPEPVGGSEVIRFRAFGRSWRFDDAKEEIAEDKMPPRPSVLIAPEDVMHTRNRASGSTSLTIENATPAEIELFWVEGRGKKRSYGKIAPGQSSTQQTYGGHIWMMADASGRPLAGVVADEAPSLVRVTGKVAPAKRGNNGLSPDGKWRASIRDHNVIIEPASGGDAIRLTTDGSLADSYTRPLEWSPDSGKLIAYRVKEAPVRKVHIVQSSPPDQVQPKLMTLDYAKPGDEIRQTKPCLLDITNRRVVAVDDSLFDNPWNIRDGAWSEDSTEFTFVYNQRGHQVMRIVGIRADSGSTRTIHEERSGTFIDYSQKYLFRRIPGGRAFLWASERDGYNHLYSIDAASGEARAITSGSWNVLELLEVDEQKQRLLIKVNGMPGSDPYHEHFARVNLDGSGFTRLTESDGKHDIRFSPDGKWIIAVWSRVDQPPVTEIRNAETGRLLCEINRADDSALRETGWSRPERFVAKGRDGKTDIHGIIVKPRDFDPAKKYPVVEEIYAGPHDYFVPKGWFAWSGENHMAELGFIVVRIDGMGTNWRCKTFHDVCWKNLGDSGFPDRIAWIKAAAATRPWMDLTRVGIYGGSAGGQSTLSGLLHHGDFYKAGVADCGCHDNRMDKIWWNEAWMGWPVDASYEQSSNVFHAAKLTGRLMLIVGELDTNVDPASTAQVVAALQRAGRNFDFVPVMNAGHGAAETPYGKYRRADFLVRHLQQPGTTD